MEKSPDILASTIKASASKQGLAKLWITCPNFARKQMQRNFLYQEFTPLEVFLVIFHNGLKTNMAS